MQRIINLQDYLSKIPYGDKLYSFLTEITEETPRGRHDISDKVYVNVVSYETKDGFDGIFESHRDYIDLHVLIKGEEKIYYGKREGMTVTKEYDKAGDYELLTGDNYSAAEYSVMQGIECEKGEPHMAGGNVSASKKVLKAIVKIKSRYDMANPDV